jgi:hypothetical protein
MPPSTLQSEAGLIEGRTAGVLPGRTVLIVVAGILAAWLAAGSLGWMAPALAKLLTWAALGLAVGAAWPACDGRKARGRLLAAAAVALVMTFWAAPLVHLLAVVLVLAVIAGAQPGECRRAVLTAALAAAALAVFRMASESSATAWVLADTIARPLGAVAGWVAGRPLEIGPSFAGLDFLVVMGTLWLGWISRPQAAPGPPRYLAAAGAAAAILVVHAAYLLLLARACDLAAVLPLAVPPPASEISRLGFWRWSDAVRAWLPWGLPVLAAAGHAGVAGIMFRWAHAAPRGYPARPLNGQARPLNIPPSALRLLPAGLAIVAAWALLLDSPRADLKGLRVLAYQAGDFESCGLLGPLVESLGGQLDRSDTLTAAELAQHNMLLLLPPKAPGLHPGDDLLPQILEFVRHGGALLVAAAPEQHPGAIENVFNELLAPTGIQVEEETCCSLVYGWEENLEAAPAARGGLVGPAASFGLDHAARLRPQWPAAPLVMGRWGWGEPGAGFPHVAAYRPGQRLGDLVLAAQRQLGRGRVVVLGDAGCLSDRRLPSSYRFVTRLLASLAGNSVGPLAPWRQWLGLAALAGLLALVAWPAAAAGGGQWAVGGGRARYPQSGPAGRPETMSGDAEQGKRLTVAVLTLAAAVAGFTLAGDIGAAWLLPVGQPKAARPLVYVDASHVPAASNDPEQDDGLGQWTDVLAANGYLPLWAPDLSPARLKRAAVLVLVAPARPLNSAEREAVREFVEGGGSLLVTAGAEESRPCLPLLAEYEISVPEMPQPPWITTPEPTPLGAAVQIYTHAAGEQAEAQFYAAWAARGPLLPQRPLFAPGFEGPAAMVSDTAGWGAIVVIADTYFATNKNFQAEEGDARQNAHFWAWLLAGLTGRKAPPAPKTETTGPSELGPLDAAGPKLPVQPQGKAPSSRDQRRDAPRALEPAEHGIIETPKASEAKP